MNSYLTLSLIKELDLKVVSLKVEHIQKFILTEVIKVTTIQKGQKGILQELKFHESLSMNNLIENSGLGNYSIQIKVNGNQFTGSSIASFKSLGITSNDLIEFEGLSFKSVVYLQSAEGYWSETLLDLIGQTDKDLWYKADQSKWKLIEKKAINYLKQQLLTEQNEIDKLISQVIL